MNLEELIKDEELQIKNLNDIVFAPINEQNNLAQSLMVLDNDDDLAWSQKIADKVAEFGGSWKFILSFCFFIIIWIALNSYFLLRSSFDPYPFILLNLILSCIAALQAPIIMMSQNRQEEKDRRRARSDYLVNLKAEMEIRSLHKKLDLLMTEQVQHLYKIQQAQLELLKEIKEKR